MNKFNLIIKFFQISQEWKIPKSDEYNYDFYFDYFENIVKELEKNELNCLNSKLFSKSIQKIANYIFLFNYIENNYFAFKSKLDCSIAKQLKNNGYICDESELIPIDLKFDKDLIFNIYYKKETSNHNVVSLNFSFLDKNYLWKNKEFYNANLSSLVTAIDKYHYDYHYLEIKNQTDKKDRLFATLTINIDSKELCEKSVLWLSKTTWAPFFDDVQKMIKSFCDNNKIKYHFPYTISIKRINDVLKNINWRIKNAYFELQSNFYKSQKNLIIESKNISCKKINEFFYEKYKKIINFLYLKTKLLQKLIYLNNILKNENKNK